MKHLFLILFLLPAFVLGGCFEQKPKEIKIINAHAFATAPLAKTGAVFMVIENNLDADDKLVEVKSGAAEINEIHQNYIDPDDGTMMMRKIRGIDLPSGEEVVLDPKGLHVMLIKLREPLKLDEVFDLQLVFENAPAQTVQVKIVKPGMSLHGH